ncbi:MAG: hypothetical protein EOO27_09850 [Comamonadaceae bacterium]|jgi:hypothetical protein|nr:MAG: hypothetical protein EOO27_09850 [Comamonadaceae bacterium]
MNETKPVRSRGAVVFGRTQAKGGHEPFLVGVDWRNPPDRSEVVHVGTDGRRPTSSPPPPVANGNGHSNGDGNSKGWLRKAQGL